MNKMTALNKIAILQYEQDCQEHACTELKSTINEVGFPIC
jgi:hypothetical protein